MVFSVLQCAYTPVVHSVCCFICPLLCMSPALYVFCFRIHQYLFTAATHEDDDDVAPCTAHVLIIICVVPCFVGLYVRIAVICYHFVHHVAVLCALYVVLLYMFFPLACEGPCVY